VINFELPGAPEDYVHRIGRTGRAGSSGRAISLVCADEHEKLAAIEKFIKLRIPQTIVRGFEPDASGVSALMHTERERPDRRPERGSSLTRGGRSHGARAPAKAADSIFSAPYVPMNDAPAASEPARPAPQQKGRQVAALLGGLRKSG
jgi:ATP-dependent RNA helicase RhlE